MFMRVLMYSEYADKNKKNPKLTDLVVCKHNGIRTAVRFLPCHTKYRDKITCIHTYNNN